MQANHNLFSFCRWGQSGSPDADTAKHTKHILTFTVDIEVAEHFTFVDV
jgi:hypothetical protein